MTKKNQIKTGIVIIITCVMCFSSRSFAADGDGDALSFTLNYIVSVLGWIRVFFANLAGTFLTNNWIYGEILGWDSLLWKYWNVIKNIANFGLGFYFIYVLFKGLIKKGKDSVIQNLKKITVRLLIAGIGIQASWFFVATVIDISSITLAAAGSFPSQVISSSPYIAGSMRQSLSEYLSGQNVNETTEITLFPTKNGESLLKTEKFEIKSKSNENYDQLVDSFMPNSNSVAGPLYFIGFSILKTNVITSINTSDNQGIKATIFNTIIQGGTTIIFSIEMAILCVLALMRIIYLWMFIIMSPIAILIRCIEKTGEKIGNDDKSFLSRLTKQINFKSFFINVFKPTIIVLGFGFALLLVSLMNKVVLDYNNSQIDIGGIKIRNVTSQETNINGNKGDNKYTTNMESDILSFTLRNTGKGILDLLLSIITVILVYFIIRFAIKFGNGKDFVSEKIEKVQKEVGSLMGSIPIVPVAGYDEEGKPTTHFINANNTFGLGGKDSIIEQKIRRKTGKEREKISNESDIINSWFGNKTGHLTQAEQNNITRALNTTPPSLQSLQQTKAIIQGLDEKKGMTLNPQTASNNNFWINEFKTWLNNVDTSTLTTDQKLQKMVIDRRGETDVSKRSLEKLFKTQGHAQTYADFFDIKGKFNNWNDIKNEDISGNNPQTQ